MDKSQMHDLYQIFDMGKSQMQVFYQMPLNLMANMTHKADWTLKTCYFLPYWRAHRISLYSQLQQLLLLSTWDRC